MDLRKLIRINRALGWTLIFGMLTTQVIITNITFDMGQMAPFFAFLTAVIFLPFITTAIASVLNRERNPTKIKIGIVIGLIFQVGLPVILPLFFDKEFICLSIVGILLGVIMWYFRKKLEVQLLILNGIGAIIWILISLSGLLSF